MSRQRTSDDLLGATAFATSVGLDELLARAERAEREVESWLRGASAADVACGAEVGEYRARLRELYAAIGARVVQAARDGRTIELVQAVDAEAVVAGAVARALPSELAKTLPPEYRAESIFDTLRPDGHRPESRLSSTHDAAVAAGVGQLRSSSAGGSAAARVGAPERLKNSKGAPSVSRPPARKARQQDQLAELRHWYERMGPTPLALADGHAVLELENIESFVDDAVDSWGLLTKTRNFQLTAWLTKRLRAVQSVFHDDPTTPAALTERLDIAFRTVSVHSKTTRPGFVFGLALGHEPESESWLLDALERERAIRRELGLPPLEDASR